MRRRLFLQALGLGLVTAAVRRARADASCAVGPAAPRGETARASTRLIDEARRRARASGKKLLVVVAPADENQRRARGEAVGELLEYGSAEALYPLAFVEPVVATVEELRAAGIEVKGEPPYVAVDADGAITRAGEPRPGRGGEAEALAAAVLAPQAAAETRVRVGRAAQDRWRRRAIPGSRWGYMEGCGYRPPAIHTDNDEVDMIGCGMGSMGAASRRFVRLYASAIATRR